MVDGIDVTRFGYDTLLRAREGTLHRSDDERATREYETATRQVRRLRRPAAVGGRLPPFSGRSRRALPASAAV